MSVTYLEALPSSHHPLPNIIIGSQGGHSEGVAAQKSDVFRIPSMKIFNILCTLSRLLMSYLGSRVTLSRLMVAWVMFCTWTDVL